VKKIIISGAAVVVVGLLIALGPQLLFKVCTHGESSFPLCHWSARVEIGVGLLIAALGICLIIFPDSKTHLGLFIGIFLAGIIALFIPYTLIGGCTAEAMACRKAAFPALTVESILLVVFSVVMTALIETKKHINNYDAGDTYAVFGKQ
jgi:hypothetical protein